ncbi:hypothetical protein AB0D04_08920 [Streptomyces sp. NPDC048483]|uniref:hypothetical protein n=1 Tax=Streptomyces sp. NPDC048483 TaxID=3154927 RepID=UPI003443FB75
MSKALRMVAGTLGAGALLASAAGTASAGSGEGRFEDVRCAPSFSLLLPPDGGCNIFIDNHKALALLKQTAGGGITDTSVTARRGGGRR